METVEQQQWQQVLDPTTPYRASSKNNCGREIKAWMNRWMDGWVGRGRGGGGGGEGGRGGERGREEEERDSGNYERDGKTGRRSIGGNDGIDVQCCHFLSQFKCNINVICFVTFEM